MKKGYIPGIIPESERIKAVNLGQAQLDYVTHGMASRVQQEDICKAPGNVCIKCNSCISYDFSNCSRVARRAAY